MKENCGCTQDWAEWEIISLKSYLYALYPGFNIHIWRIKTGRNQIITNPEDNKKVTDEN